MTSPTRYPQELRERAVRMVLAHGGEYPSEGAALGSISAKLGMTRETLRRWVRRAQVNGGLRSGVTTAERERIRELERENREPRRANEILRAASLFSLGSSTRDRPSREVHRR
jgi:transposase-like protein